METRELKQLIELHTLKPISCGEFSCQEMKKYPGVWYVTITDIIGTLVCSATYVVNVPKQSVLPVPSQLPTFKNIDTIEPGFFEI